MTTRPTIRSARFTLAEDLLIKKAAAVEEMSLNDFVRESVLKNVQSITEPAVEGVLA